MIYEGGNGMDYEGWGEGEGMESWEFGDCLAYFKKVEKRFGAGRYDKYRGDEGGIKLKRGGGRNGLFK